MHPYTTVEDTTPLLSTKRLVAKSSLPARRSGADELRSGGGRLWRTAALSALVAAAVTVVGAVQARPWLESACFQKFKLMKRNLLST